MRNLFSIVVIIIGVVSSVCAKAGSPWPADVNVPGVLAAFVEQVYAQSETFRAQCDRLGQATHLEVNLKLDVAIPYSCRAFTIIHRKQGMLCAEVHLPPGSQLAELLGHEFEHIIEQLEHLNLRALARVRGSGVHEFEFELFETDRAQRTGRIVADEVRMRHERPSAD